MDILNKVKKRFENELENKEDDYIQSVAEWFSYIILSNNKYRIDHSNDEPGDHSGEIIKTNKKMNPSDYRVLFEFLETEYTGNKEASYRSGSGWNFESYKEVLEYLTLEWLQKQLEIVINKLDKKEINLLIKYINNEVEEDVSKLSISDLINLIFFEELTDIDFILKQIELIESIRNIKTTYLFKIGKNKAREKIKNGEKIKTL